MNIYDSYREVNDPHPQKHAMSKRFASGELEEYTYAQMTEKVDRYADTLLSAGLTPGDRVAFVSEGMPEWTIAFLAAAKIHCTSVLIDASLSADELTDYIERSDVRAAFFSTATVSKFEHFPEYKFPVYNIYDGTVFDGCVSKVSDELPETPDKDEEIATIIFSSGTTRRAAGIMHYHDSLIKTTQMTLKEQKLSSEDRFLAVLPNSHIYGVICLVLGPILSGADIHYIDGLSGEAVLKAFGEYHPTVFPAVPKVYELFMTQVMKKINSKALTKTMFKVFFPICLKKRYKNGSLLGKKLFKSIHEGFGGSLEFLCSAGAPLKKEVAEFFYGTGFNIIITYGASETNIPTIGNFPGKLTTDSCGTPYPAIKTKVSDTGELLIKSPFMMKGYFRDEESTKAAFDDDGWFLTGDLVSVNEKGYYSVTGRSKENIVLASGKKVTPDDIEAKYTGVSGVKEFVICGVPAEGADYDEVHAFIVPESTSPEAHTLIKNSMRLIGNELPSYMKIQQFHFENEIPRTSLQKPKRYLLKKMALEERQSGVKTVITAKADKTDITGTVKRIIAEIANVSVDDVTENTQLFNELPIDSLSSINLALQLEDALGVNIEPYYTDNMTVADVISALKGTSEIKNVIGQSQDNYPLEKDNKDYYMFCFFRNLARFFYKLKIAGKENVPKDKGFIICANHVSKIDYLYIANAFSKEEYKHLCCMAKKELFKDTWFSRRLIKSTGMTPVDRSGMNMQIMNNLCKRLDENWGVVIHPEGTRSEDGVFRTMKSGAAVLAIDAGVPVIPAYIDGAYEIIPKDKKTFSLFDWKHFKAHCVTLTFGKAIDSAGAGVEELTEKIQNAILDLQKKAKDE